jgi:PKD repeat protein
MKYLILFITILTLAFQVKSQTNIVGYEYWFDNDFSSRVVTNVAPSAQLDINSNIPTTGINAGIHSFNFRSWDDSSRYSSIVSQFFYKISPSTAPTNRNIVEYEYWFDNDYANAVTQTVTSQQSLDLNTIIATGTINSGIHSFNIRFKDDTELWSSVLSQFFYKISPSTAPTNRNIVEYEYWFDNDYANAVIQTVTSQQSLDLNTIIATGTINSGIHSFNIRFKDDTELWSSVLSQFFYKISPSTSPTNRNIVEYEYWFDNDYANAVTQTVTSQQSLDLNTIIATGTINSGIHSFNIRFKDDTELWSSVLSQFFYKMPEQVNLVTNKITTYRYWFDHDFAQANSVTLATPVKNLNLIDDLDLTQITKGMHSIHFQFKDSLDMWSVVTSDSIRKLPLPIADFNYVTSANCDSTTVTFTENSIDGDTYLWDFGDGDTSAETDPTHTFYNTNIYNVSLTVTDTATGLDSTVVIPLDIKTNTFSTIQATACESFTSPSGNYVWTTSSNYMDTIPNSNNCDSIITVNLTINNAALVTDTRTECDSLVWMDGNTYYSSNNSATYTLPGGAANSCDSIITLDLTINTVDASVTKTDPSITANATGATYQWLDCNNGNLPISGETSQTFTAISNGSYAVEVTQNGCTDTSACVSITTVGVIENGFKNNIILYPNPTDGNFTIDMGTPFERIKIVITDNNGRLIQSNTFDGEQILKMSIEEPPGVYLLTIVTGDKKAVIRMIKE